MEKIIRYIDEKNIKISQWLVGFTGIILIRFLFESLSSSTNAGVIPSDTYTIMHTWFFFLATTLGIACIVGWYTKDYNRILKLSLFGLPLIWLGPILDSIISLGKGYNIGYLQDSGIQIIKNFLTFFGPKLTEGATYGLRIEMFIILVGIGWYVWFYKKNIFQGIAAAVISYAFIFLLFSIPGIFYTFAHLNNTNVPNTEAVKYIAKIILNSNISHNTFRDGLSYVSLGRLVEMGFDKFMSQIFFILSFIFGIICFWKIDSKKFSVILKNSRPERIIFFLCLLFLGMGYSYFAGYGKLISWFDPITVLCLMLSFAGAWVYSVHINDLADKDIDEISNKNRPLVLNELTPEEMQDTGYIWLTMAVVGSWASGFYPFYMVLVYLGASYIYSSPPLRLRVVPLLSTFLISIASLVTFLSGFFFVSIDKRTQIFPLFIAIGILIIFTLIINIKDLKDIEGDKKSGVRTLATIYKDRASKAVGLCFAIGILFIPFFLSFYTLYLTAIPTAIIGYRIINKKPFIEKKIFILGFFFVLGSILLTLLLYWILITYKL